MAELVSSTSGDGYGGATAFPDHIAELAAAGAELARLTAEAEALAEEETTATEAALVPLNRQSPAEIKAGLATIRRRAVAKRAEVEAAAGKVRELAERQALTAREVIAPLAKQIKRLEDGIAAVNLYLGDEESIVTLRDGDPAPASEPLHIRQLVLSMDEECAVASDTGGIDFMSMEAFDEWLVADPAHVDQVLPEKKGIVALVPRMSGKDYGDPWASAALNERNVETYLLIRNGERLHRYCPRFTVGKRLVPAADEFTRFFEVERWDHATGTKTKEPLRPGSREWVKAEEKADDRQRHYMKVALMIQGLVDRTVLLHPLPPEGLDLLRGDAYDDGRAAIITDAENALGTGNEAFGDWLRRTNSKMDIGMRVVGAFDSNGFRQLVDERWYAHGKRKVHERISPVCDDRPKTARIYTLEDRRAVRGVSGYVFYFNRGQVWTPYEGYKDAQRRASCMVTPWDDFVLCLDLAEVADMERFLQSRATRRGYVTMFPVLKAAIAAKRGEEAEEEPFRAMLAGELAKRNGVDVEDALDAVPDLVSWFKFSRKHHRALVGDDPKIVEAICTEHRRRQAERVDGAAEAGVVAELRERHPDLLYVGRKRDGHYVAFVPQVEGGWWSVYVKEIERTTSGKETVTEWRLPGARPNRWRTLYESERWVNWDRSATATVYASGPEVQAAVETLRAGWDPEWGPLAAITFTRDEFSEGEGRSFWCWAYDERPEFDREHPLTKAHRGLGERHAVVGWHRGRGGFLLGSLRRPERGYQRAVDTSGGDFEPIWRHHHRSDQIEILFEDEKVIDQMKADLAGYQEFERLRSELSSEARELHGAIRTAWRERAEQQAYAKFIEDYQDPDRWEAHRKTLKVDWPSSHHRAWERLGEVLDRLVESGIPVAGRRVDEVVAVAQKLTGENVEVPEDLGNLWFPPRGAES